MQPGPRHWHNSDTLGTKINKILVLTLFKMNGGAHMQHLLQQICSDAGTTGLPIPTAWYA